MYILIPRTTALRITQKNKLKREESKSYTKNMFNTKEGSKGGTEEQKTHYMWKRSNKMKDVNKTILIVLNMCL